MDIVHDFDDTSQILVNATNDIARSFFRSALDRLMREMENLPEDNAVD